MSVHPRSISDVFIRIKYSHSNSIGLPFFVRSFGLGTFLVLLVPVKRRRHHEHLICFPVVYIPRRMLKSTDASNFVLVISFHDFGKASATSILL